MKKNTDLKQLLEQYQLSINQFDEEYKRLSVKIARQEEICKQAQEKITALKKKLDHLEHPSVYASVINPLAEELAKHFNMHANVYGPCGLMSEMMIVLAKDKTKSICEQPTISLTLRISNGMVLYDAGKRINRYPKDSIGELNGMNKVFEPLPMDFDEIVKLCVKSKGVDEQ